jgi:sugar lactone lactonase YvrE
MLGRHGLIGRDTDLTRYGGVLSPDEGTRRAANVNGGAPMSAYAYDTNNATGISGTVRAVVYGKDGFRAYVTILGNNRTGAAVHQLDLSTPYDLASRSNPSKSVVVGDWFLNCNAVTFNAAGTKMYVGGYNVTNVTDERVIEFNLATAWELNSATPVVKKLWIGNEETTARGLTFKPDGTKLYVIGTAGDDINQYDLSTAWDISTATFVTSQSVGAGGVVTTPVSVVFKDDGTKAYVLNNGNDAVYQFSLTTAWLLSSLTYDNVSFSVATQEATPNGIFIGNNGTNLYVSGSAGDNVVRYTMSTAWNLSTATFTSESAGTGDTAPQGIFFRDNGATLYVAANAAGTIRTYNLTGAAWDTGSTNLSLENAVGPFFSASGMYDVYIGDNGTKLYWLDQTRNSVYQAPLGTAWDVSSVQGILLAANLVRYESLRLEDDDTKLFVTDAGASVNRYTLSTPGRLHTATLDHSQNMGVANVYGIAFSPDGRKFYAVGVDSYSVFRFSLYTAWDLTTSSLDGYISAGGDVGTYAQTVPDFGHVAVNPDATQIEVWCFAGGTVAFHRWKLRF